MKSRRIMFFCIGVAALGIVVLFNLRNDRSEETSESLPSDEVKTENSTSAEDGADTPNMENEDGITARIRYEKDLIYDSNDRDNCRVDVAYRRDGKKKPLIICVHGGYYSSGSKTDMKKYLTALSEEGFVTASVDYPLLPDGTIVKQIESVIKATDYFAENADIYEIDKNNITLLGFSSGAHIAVCAAEKIAVRQSNYYTMASVIDISGPTDYRYLIEKYGGADSVSPGIIDGNEEADLLEELKKVDCTDNITGNLPRVMIIHGKRDQTVPYEVSERFFDSLKTAGVNAELKTIYSMGHVTDLKKVIPLIELFLGGDE